MLMMYKFHYLLSNILLCLFLNDLCKNLQNVQECVMQLSESVYFCSVN